LLTALVAVTSAAFADAVGTSGPSAASQATLIDDLAAFALTRLPASLPRTALKIDKGAKPDRGRLEFLDRDFRTRAFGHATSVEEALLETSEAGQPLHLGLFVVDFASCADLQRALRSVSGAHRTSLRLPVLTIFRAIPVSRRLVFVVSETAARSDVARLLEQLDTFRIDARRCDPQEEDRKTRRKR
jgi:hypothetical protein